jgi:hypothetical protein
MGTSGIVSQCRHRDGRRDVGVIHAPLSNITSKRLQARVIEVKRSDITKLAVGGLFPLTNYAKAATPAEQMLERQLRAQLMRAEQALLEELLASPA